MKKRLVRVLTSDEELVHYSVVYELKFELKLTSVLVNFSKKSIFN